MAKENLSDASISPGFSAAADSGDKDGEMLGVTVAPIRLLLCYFRESSQSWHCFGYGTVVVFQFKWPTSFYLFYRLVVGRRVGLHSSIIIFAYHLSYHTF